MASLFVIRGRDQGRHVIVPEGGITIGRDRSCGLQLQDTEASRQHALLEASNEPPSLWQVRDLGSSNGTYLNGEKITAHRLHSGDRLQIGRTLLIFSASQPSEKSASHGASLGGVEIVLDPAGTGDQSQIVSTLPQPSAREGSAHEGGFPPSDSIAQLAQPLNLLIEVATAVGRTLEIPELLERILQLVFDWVGADRGCIMLVDHESGNLRVAAHRDRRGASPVDRLAISRTILDYVVSRKEAVRTSNASDDARFDAAASIVQAGIREALCVPLQGRYGVVGALYVDTFTTPGRYVEQGYRGRFTDDQLRLVVAIGCQAALAIEDSFYYSALVQSERLAAVGQTIATLSHHIKNILQGLRGGGYLVTAGLERHDEQAIRRGWQIVERNQERIAQMVLDMLSLSKERQPEPTGGDLRDLIDDVMELALPRATEANVALSLVSPEQPAIVMFDAEAMHRAVLNLVLNAIDALAAEPSEGVEEEEDEDSASHARQAAMAGQKLVKIGWGHDARSQQAWIEVDDNGPGIALADQEAIFTLFSSRKGARGTGLGLPASRKIAREHGGDIRVVSEPGKGSRFRIEWPSGVATGETLPG
jgi:signal transduction histidine kinase